MKRSLALGLPALMLAAGIARAAEPVTRFDGAYAGLYQLIDGAPTCVKQFGALLQIQGGRVTIVYSKRDNMTFTGSVDGEGKLSAQTNVSGSAERNASVLKGGITGDVFQGKAESNHCTYALQLRKKSGA
jgi:2-C-methyl-D-erythritol 4-phosphate cytidylyltransferase